MGTIVKRVVTEASSVGSIGVIPVTPPVVAKCNVAGNFRLRVRSGVNKSVKRFFTIARGFLTTLGRHPRVTVTCASFGPGFPRCLMGMSPTIYGETKISPTAILSALTKCCKKRCISGVGEFSRICEMVVRTSPRCHVAPRSLGTIRIEVSGKRVTPLDRFIRLAGMCKTRALSHFGLCGSVTIGNSTTRKCSSKSTVGTIGRITRRALPEGCKFRFTKLSHRRRHAKGGTLSVCTVYVILVCLVLYTFCRDFLVPLTIVVSIPYKVVKSFLFTGFFKLRGGVCLRANIVVLVNLLTGATVLVARCTSSHHGTKVAVGRTTVTSTGMHLHPVLVATLAVIFNVLPVVFTSNINTGNGSTLKAKTINNVLIKALVLLFFMPTLFIMFRALRRGFGPIRFRRARSGRVSCRVRNIQRRGETGKRRSGAIGF